MTAWFEMIDDELLVVLRLLEDAPDRLWRNPPVGRYDTRTSSGQLSRTSRGTSFAWSRLNRADATRSLSCPHSTPLLQQIMCCRRLGL
jgi:hypothetical protein